MVYEMYIDNGITVDEIDSTSGTLVVGKINSKIDGTKTRSIIHFNKYTISPKEKTVLMTWTLTLN